MEVVGFAFGAVALVGPAYQLYRDCSALFIRTRTYLKEVKRYGDKLSVQQRIFANECELILSLITEKEEAAAMLEDREHWRWTDSEFILRWNATMESHFDVALQTVSETLKTIQEKMKKLQSHVKDCTSDSQASTLSREQRFKTFRWKAEWGISGKEEIQKLIETLRVQNTDLMCIRKQRESSKSNSKPRFRKSLEQSPNPDAVFAKVLQIREISKTLYQSLAATAGCHCHRVNLELQGYLEQVESPADSSKAVKFRLIVSNDSDSNSSNLATSCHCTSIIINSEFDSPLNSAPVKRRGSMGPPCPSSKRVRFASPDEDEDSEPHIETTSAKAVITISDDSNTNGKRTVSIDIGPGRKKVRLSFDPSAQAGGIPTAKIASNTALSVAEVDNLCILMQNLQPGKPLSECLGRISTKGCNTVYRHLIYRGGPSSFQTSRTSLRSILCREDKQTLIPRLERLRIAVTLAMSILHLGSYSASWFQERWRSKDIFFFLKPQQRSLAYGQNGLQPHVVPAFPRAVQNAQDFDVDSPSAYIPSVARNEQLFSLALVLIEIAFGDTLFKIYEPAKIAKKEDDPFSEYMKAKMILDSGQLEREMGVAYAQVVKRCLYCEFGILEEDLSKKEMQEIFYRMVVAQLEGCLKSFGKFP